MKTYMDISSVNRFNDFINELFEEKGAEGVVDTLSFLYGAFVITKAGIIVGANQRFFDLIQYSKAELYGMQALDVITPDERDPMIARFSTNDVKRYELKLVTKSKKVKTVIVTPKAFSYKDENYRLAEFVDISEKKEIEQRLKDEQVLLKRSQELAKLGYWSFDLESKKQEWSDGMFTMLGLDPNQSPPEFGSHQFLFTAEGNEKLSKAIEDSVKTGRPYEIEIEMIRSDGIHGWMLARGEPKYSDTETVTGLFGIAIDISNQREAQNNIKQLLEKQRIDSKKLENALIKTVGAVALTAEKRDPYTAGHMARVAELSVAIGKKLKLSDHALEGIYLGATIHDIGKIYIPAEILNRSGVLTDTEYSIIKSHSQVGYDIIKDVDFPWPIADMVLSHHERLDGSGYPNGIKGEDISFEAQLLAVADVVEAVSSHRPYRPALGFEAAVKIIKDGKGKLFNPEVVDACVELLAVDGFEFTIEY